MRTIEDGFLEAILEQPVDDSPRLIFADWLEETGQEERAEFIRVQCALAACSLCQRIQGGGCVNHARLPFREQELRSDSSRALDWLRGSRFEWDYFQPVLRRGFVEEITLSLPAWLLHGKELVQATPLRIVQLTCEQEYFASVHVSYEQALIGWLRQLAQDDEPGDNPVGRLHTLDLSGINIRSGHLTAAMNAAYRPWRGLRVLVLPPWRNLFGARRTQEIEQWKKRVPSLERVEFAPSSTIEELSDEEVISDLPRPVAHRVTGRPRQGVQLRH